MNQRLNPPAVRRFTDSKALLATGVLVAALCAVPAAPALAEQPAGVGEGRIVFAGESDTGQQLWTVWPNGTHLRQITHVAGDASQPDWSPDGKTITFEWALPDDTAPDVHTAFVDADGSNLRMLPNGLGACANGQPSFTPDGQRVIADFFNCDTGDTGLLSRKLDGSDVQRITAAGSPDGYTDGNASPDGTQLSYVRFANGVEQQQALTVSGADGSGAHDIVPPARDVGIKTAWSPDSSRIVFTPDANAIDDGPLEANVATIARDGSDLRLLTHFSGGSMSAFAGSYSPDGRWIVFRLQNNDAGTSGLYKMWTDGSHQTLLFTQPGLRARSSDWGGPAHVRN
jgi:Tol biopolymer transport system component